MADSYNFPGLPVLAILRGITPKEVLSVAERLIAHDIRRIEVPLNSPSAFQSIELLISQIDSDVLIGAGTVLTSDEVNRLADMGCQIVVSPNFDRRVIEETKARGMISCPGVFTPSEAFAALKAGADILKYFPAELGGPAAIRAWRAVLPPGTPLMATGGTNAETLFSWLNAGADMIGVGSALYKPGDTPDDIRIKASDLKSAAHEYRKENA